MATIIRALLRLLAHRKWYFWHCVISNNSCCAFPTTTRTKLKLSDKCFVFGCRPIIFYFDSERINLASWTKTFRVQRNGSFYFYYLALVDNNTVTNRALLIYFWNQLFHCFRKWSDRSRCYYLSEQRKKWFENGRHLLNELLLCRRYISTHDFRWTNRCVIAWYFFRKSFSESVEPRRSVICRLCSGNLFVSLQYFQWKILKKKKNQTHHRRHLNHASSKHHGQ